MKQSVSAKESVHEEKERSPKKPIIERWGAIIVAIIGLIGVLVSPIVTKWAERLFAPTPTSVVVAPTGPSISTTTTTPTHTATPMPSEEVVIEIDGAVKDASDDRCQEVDCGSSLRVEVKVLDSTGAKLQSGIFSYNWRFNPSDPHNPDRLDSKNYAIIYSVPCDRNSQTVTIEVLKNGKALYVRSIRFNIKKQW